MEMIFESHYNIGDRVKIRKGEHNNNWAGKIGKIVEIGIDLYKLAYIVSFNGEIYKPCFLGRDLIPFYRKKKNPVGTKILVETEYNIGDKVKTLPNVKPIKSALYVDGKTFDVNLDNHLPLEKINFAYVNKLGWCSPDVYHWFNNMVVYLNVNEDAEIWEEKIGEIIEIAVDGTEKSHSVIYSVKYFDEKCEEVEAIPCFLENDLELLEDA